MKERSVHVKIRIKAGYVTTSLGKLQFSIKPVLESYSVLLFIQGADRSVQIVQLDCSVLLPTAGLLILEHRLETD